MSLPPEDADLSTRSAHESAFRVESHGSPVRVVGSPVGQRIPASPAAQPNEIQRVSHADSRCSTTPSRGNSLVRPKRSEEAAAIAAAAQLPWAESQGHTPLSPSRGNSLGSHLLPAEPASATSTTNAYSSPPGDSRFAFANQNYSPLLPRCVAVPNQHYSPAGSPLHRLQELQNCQLTDSPLRLRFPSPLLGNSDGPLFTPNLLTPNTNRRVGSQIEFEQNHQLTYPIQQVGQQRASANHQQNIQLVSELQPLHYQVHEQNHPIVTQIQEETLQVFPETQVTNIQEQTDTHVKKQNNYESDIQELDQKLECVVSGQNLPIVTKAQEQNDQTITEIQEENQIVPEVQEKNLPFASDIKVQDQQTVTEIPEKCIQLASPVVTDIEVQSSQILTEIHEQNHQTITEIQEESPIVFEIQEKNLPFAAKIQEQDEQTVTEIPEDSFQLASPVETDIQVESTEIVTVIQDDDVKLATDNQELDLQTIPGILEKHQQIESEFSQEHNQQTAEIQTESLQFASEIEEQGLQIVTEIQQQNHENVIEVQEESLQFTPDTQNADQPTEFIEIQEENQQFASDNQEQDLQTVTEIQEEYHEFSQENLQFATYIQEQSEQIAPKDQQADQLEEPQDLIVTEIQEQSAQLASEFQEYNQKLASAFQEGDQQVYSEIHDQQPKVEAQNYDNLAGEFPGHQLGVYPENRIEVEPVNEIYEVQREGEVACQTGPTEGRQHQNLVPEDEAPFPPAEARPSPTPVDISDPASPGHGEVLDSGNPSIECIRKTFKLIREISDSLIADPEQPQAQTHRLSIFLLRQKLADVCHKILGEALHGQATEESISLLREIFVCDEQTKPAQQLSGRRSTKPSVNQQDISMGLEILKRLRDLLSGWYTSKDSESDTGETGTGFEARNGKGRGADRQPENNFSPRKRRNQEESPRLIKYRRVDNSFPRYITNETAEDLIPNKSMAERDQPQSSKRLSIFNPPVYTQHRVRNEAPYIPTPFDLSDDEEPSQTYANAGPSARPLTYSDAVRLGQNGFGEYRVNGHSNHTVRRAPAQMEKSILTHEMERMEHEQYINLIHTVAHSSSVGSRFVKPGAPPPLQRIDSQAATWSSVLRGNQSHVTKTPSLSHANRELTEYAKLIDRKAEQENRTPVSPQLLRSTSNSAASHASTISSSGSSSSGSSSCSTCSSSDSDAQTTSVTDASEDKKAKEAKNSVASQPLNAKPTRLSMTDSLHRRFASCVYLKDDFAEQFKARAARRQEESKHLLGLAEQQANQSRDERRAYELKLRENIFQYRIPHKPIFVIGPLDKAVEKKVTKLIPLTKELDDRFYDMTDSEKSVELIFKFNLHITSEDIRTFVDGEWLNDEVINFYMSLLTERSEKRAGELPATYAMNTFFVPRLLQAGHAGVKRWTRKVDLFSKDIIPVPVHCNGVHWCMAIIHLRNKTIRYYDSMGKPNQPVLDALEKYLREESLDKRKQPFDTSGFVIESVQNIPQQLNGSDCGVFSCMFAEYITRDVPITFSQSEMLYFRKKMALEIADGELWQ
ncbi:uncharacterized protein LOC122625198 [Drosophila teissieri]|uniref:uncharacterized protein LOC122625198 n=1 Tax=Drosophila teissieri TaxID=7243 RepID=UPI001CBA5038|nr:uncharacterized protein LOC122625198 [Drosophila teissieri]